MIKTLRVHSKKIMVGLVLFAMFSFVGGSALTSCFQQRASDILVMRCYGETLNLQDLNAAQADTEILGRLMFDWKNGRGEELDVRHWLMLAKEAERAGITVSSADVNRILEQRESMLMQFNAGTLADIRKQLRVSLSAMQAAVARQMAIGEYFERVRLASMPSEPQVRHYVQATEDKVNVGFVALNADQFIDNNEPVSAEDAAAQFAKYKDVLSSESPDGFGYKHPRRVKLQYVSASVSKIESQVTVTEEEIKNQWKANPNKYMKTVMIDEPAPVDPTASQPASQPVMRQVPKQVPQTYTESRDAISRELKKNKAARLARQFASRLTEELAKPWADLKHDEKTGFKPIPDSVKDPAFLRSVSAQMAAKFGVNVDYSETDFSSEEEIANDFVLRGAEMPGDKDTPISLSELAFRVPEFFTPEANKESDLRLQLFQTPILPMTVAGPASGFEIRGNQLVPKPGEPANYIVFRVIETRNAQAPLVIDEVISKVERDVRLQRAFGRVEPIAKELCAVASRIGLDLALTHFEDLRTTRGVRAVSKPAPFSRMSRITDPAEREMRARENRPMIEYSEVIGVGRAPEFVDACFEMTADNWSPPILDVPQTSAILAASTQPASVPAPKARAISISKTKTWYVIELLSTNRVNSENYESEKRQLAFQTIMGDRSLVSRLQWFDPTAIEKRCDYKDLDKDAQGRSRIGMYSPAPQQPFSFY